MAEEKTFVQHMKECIAECETKAQAVGLGKIENLLLRMAQKIDEGGGSGGGTLFVTLTEVQDVFSLTERTYTADKTPYEIYMAIDEGKNILLDAPYAVDSGTGVALKKPGLYAFAGLSNGIFAFSRIESSPSFKNGYYVDVIYTSDGEKFYSTTDLSNEAIKKTEP